LHKTAHFLVAARITCRSWQKQVPAHRGKRPLTPATHHSQSASETIGLHQGGPNTPRASGQVVRTWLQALFIVQLDTLLRWHRELFRLLWKRRSKAASHTPKIAAETIALIREMAMKNRLWGAERIRGELPKLGMHVCKRTIQKYMRRVRTPQPRGHRWSTFLHKHSAAIWSCDAPAGDRSLLSATLAFFLIELKSRRVIHVGVTRSPSDPWVVQQLREATPFGQAPKYLICDNDSKFGPCFARAATTSAVKILNTPYHAPRANAICERFLRSVRQDCLDHLLILHEKQHEPRTQWVCRLLQSGTAASRDQATASRTAW
jgi:putative transposase